MSTQATPSPDLAAGRWHLQNALRELEQAVSDLAGCEDEIPTEAWAALKEHHRQLNRFAQEHLKEAM